MWEERTDCIPNGVFVLRLPRREVNIAANASMSFGMFYYFFNQALVVLKELNVQWVQVLNSGRKTGSLLKSNFTI